LTVLLAEWADAISDLADEQIGLAIRAMRDRHPEWPPTTGEFRKLCIPDPAEKPGLRYPLFQALPEPPISLEQRARGVAILEGIKAKLEGGE
jgi:hypothetical protein